MPAAELAKPPLYRHIDYFDGNHDGTLTVKEMTAGLKALGLSSVPAFAMAFGTAFLRGTATEGHPSLKLDIGNAMKSAQEGRSGVFDLKGEVDPVQVENFLKEVDPTGKGRVNQADFNAAGKRLAESKEEGHSIIGMAKRAKMEFQFSLAWKSLIQVAGKPDAEGHPSLSHADIRAFFDGSLFYELAAEHQTKP